MATIESLANETLCKIISMLKEPSLSPWQVNFGLNVPRNDDLLAAALVCSRWTDPAQRALCDTIKIDLRRDPLKLQQLRDSSSFFWHGFNPNYPLKASDTANLPTILDAFPSPATLTHLSIGTDDFSSLEHIIPVLGHPTLALLTKLDLPKLPVIAPIEQASTLAAMAKACEDHGIRWSMGGIKVWSNLGACVQRTAGGAEDRGWIGRVRSEDLRLTMS
ncbi:hypothetical protein RQP46_003212 [Phenoliferia psychrophenolica]